MRKIALTPVVGLLAWLASCSSSSVPAANDACTTLTACCATAGAGQAGCLVAAGSGSVATCTAGIATYCTAIGTSGSGCPALSACCTTMTGPAAATCMTIVAEGADATCNDELTIDKAAGLCGAAQTSGSGSSNSGCALLASCCSMMSGTSQTTCEEFVAGANSATCSAELEAYESTGSCSHIGTGSGSSTTQSSGTQSGTGTSTIVTTTNTSTTETTGTTSMGPVGPTPAPGSVAIATTGSSAALFEIIGLTSDDYLVYFDATGGISASDISGNVTQIAPGPKTDGGLGPVAAGLGGNVVAVLTNYTTTTVAGQVEPLAGTLSVWSHTKTGGKLVQVATDATGVINIATDSSYVVYADAADSTGARGNIGVVSGAGTGAVDIVKGVAIATTSTTCAPFATIDNGYVVTSTCAVADSGTSAAPQIASFNSASAWAEKVLATNAAPSTPYVSPYVVNFATDTAGDNVLTLSGSPVALESQRISTGVVTSLISGFAALTGGTEFFYLTPTSSFALFLEASGALGKATYATPTSVPTVSTLNAGPIYGVQVVSPDQKWEVDYNTALDSSTGAPTSLNLRSTTTGVAVPLVSNAIASTFGGQNGFTADSSFAIYTSDLKAVGSQASTGTLNTVAVSTGTINQLVSNTSVWNANPLSGQNLVYSQNYIASPYSTLPNGAASGDVYVTTAQGPGPGTLVVSGADAGNYFYVTADKSHLFYSFSQVAMLDGGIGVFPADGIYCIALPTP